jgi:hypothetical protein
MTSPGTNQILAFVLFMFGLSKNFSGSAFPWLSLARPLFSGKSHEAKQQQILRILPKHHISGVYSPAF